MPSKDPDIPTYEQAMTGPHCDEFEKAMIKEVKELEGKKPWHAELRANVPDGAQIVPLTRAFRIKRLPSGEFL